jgi:hypothetical protein
LRGDFRRVAHSQADGDEATGHGMAGNGGSGAHGGAV